MEILGIEEERMDVRLEQAGIKSSVLVYELSVGRS